MRYTFKGFTDKANKALNLAIESAERFGHDYIGSEHILIGLCKEGSGAPYTALHDAGVTAEKLESMMQREDRIVSLNPNDFTPRSKRVMQLAVSYSARTGSGYVGTEHLLIALLSGRDSYASR